LSNQSKSERLLSAVTRVYLPYRKCACQPSHGGLLRLMYYSLVHVLQRLK
jgi:hypothetical protein